jgi:hypothetical protein
MIASGAALLVAATLVIREECASDPFAARQAEVHRCMREGNWMSPPERNVRTLLAQMTSKFADDSRVNDLRREAGERLIADALRLKYAGQLSEAVLRARWAVELAPELDAAPKLLAELRAEPPRPMGSARDEPR